MEAANAGGRGRGLDRTIAQLDGLRQGYLQAFAASDKFDVRQVKSISQSEAFAKSLQNQKASFRDIWNQRKLLNQVMADQISLQRAQAVSWKKMPDGRITSDLIMPREALDNLNTARVRFGVLNSAVQSGADHMVKWGKNTQWAGRQLMVGFTVPLGIAAAATGKLAFDMDKALTQITKVYGDANSKFQDTTETIRDASMQTASNMAQMYGQSAKDTLEITAQFAASGKTGIELQNATAAATRARTLAELELQDAVDASIAMQTVYGYNATELGDAWNYINAMENQTILTAQDFSTAIPKVAGIMKELGGDIHDVGTLMTAFKAAGIDAAEGANALKTISFRSVAAYGKGLETFQSYTGQSLKQIVDETNGETIPTLIRMYEAMQNLSKPQRIAVVKDVFGIYQGNKALMVMEQMAEQGGQVAQALAVGKNSVAENAKIAQQELDRLNAQPFMKIRQAVQQVQIQLAKTGQVVLPMVAGFLHMVSGLIKGFNEMDPKVRNFLLIMAGLVALAGPITMLVGLFANLLGNLMKFGSSLGALALRFKITNAEERAQMLVAKQVSNVWDQQTSAVARLTQEIQLMNASLRETALAQAGVKEATLPSQMGVMEGRAFSIRKDTQGRTQIRDAMTGKQVSRATYDAAIAQSKVMGDINRKEAARLEMAHEEALAIEAQNQKMRTTSRRVGEIGIGVGLIASMFGGDSWVSTLGEGALILGTINSLLPGIGVALTKNLVAPFKFVGMLAEGYVGPRVRNMASNVKGLASGLVNFAKGAALPITAVIAGIMLFWKMANDAAEEHRQRIEDIGRGTQQVAEKLGVNWATAGGLPEASKTAMQRTTSIADDIRESNAAYAEAFSSQNGKSIGDKWGLAIAEGVKVRLHGGTVEAAKQATRVALDLMGTRFSDAEFETQVNVRINFDDVNAQINSMVNNMSGQFQDAMRGRADSWKEGMARTLFGSDSITKGGREQIKTAARNMWQTFQSVDASQRGSVFRQMSEAINKDAQEMYLKGLRINPELFKELGIENYNDFLQNFYQRNTVGQTNLLRAIGVDDIEGAKRMFDAMKAMNDEFARAAGIQKDNVYNTDTYRGALEVMMQTEGRATVVGTTLAEAKRRYAAAINTAADAGRALSDEEKLAILNTYRMAAGLAKTTNLADGFTDSTKKAATQVNNLATVMKNLNFNPDLTVEDVTGAYRSTLEGVNNDLVDAANDSLSREADVAMAALDRQMDAAMARFDKRADQLDAKYDARQKAMERRHQAQNDAFDRRWDLRKDRATAYYDARIKKIQAAITAEQKAEDIRQAIFEAERTRMERLAQMANTNIDFNMALNAGNLDEAAKIQNDMQASVNSWSLADSEQAASKTSQTRMESLQKQIETIEAAKDARLKALDEIERRERRLLDAQQERDKTMLENARKAAEARLKVEQDAARRYYENQKRTTQAIWEDKKRKLQLELDTIRAFIPRNEAELRAQAARIDAAYRKYGGTLRAYGGSWSKYIGDSLTNNIKRSGAEMRTKVNWMAVGTTIAQGLIKGGFGMTPAQFAAWLNGGAAPKGSVFYAKKVDYRARRWQTESRHKGGIVGGPGSSRAGYSGTNLSQSETMIRALYGEAVLNRKATAALGEEGINALNQGALPKDTGPWGPEGVSAAMIAAAAMGVMRNTLNAVATLKMQADAGLGSFTSGSRAGRYGGVSLNQEQLNNAATIMGVGRGLGASSRDLVIAIMTAMQESTLRNLNYGDRDSLGLFQQRNAWGSAADRTNPAKAARMFFLGGAQGQRGLFDFPNRNQMTLAQAAQAVQVSAFPEAYAKWANMAAAVVSGNQVNASALGDYVGFGKGINIGQYAAGTGTGWMRPVPGRVTSEFGMRYHPILHYWRLHAGIDLGSPTGTPIKASRGGRVVSAGWAGGYGNYTIVDHGNGQKTAYAHQSQIGVHPGQLVSQGQIIGRVGNTGGNSTGPHLHFEYMKNGVRVNPRQIIPNFHDGGYTLTGGLANMHPRETVLSAPLSEQLKVGLDKLAAGDNNRYDITIDMRGATVNSEVDIEKAVYAAIEKKERKLGFNRRIGS